MESFFKILKGKNQFDCENWVFFQISWKCMNNFLTMKSCQKILTLGWQLVTNFSDNWSSKMNNNVHYKYYMPIFFLIFQQRLITHKRLLNLLKQFVCKTSICKQKLFLIQISDNWLTTNQSDPHFYTFFTSFFSQLVLFFCTFI